MTEARQPAPSAEPAEQPLARAALMRRKRRDAALALPLAGVLLVASPALDALAGGGLARATLYLFAVWFVLIAAAAALARRLTDDDGGA